MNQMFCDDGFDDDQPTDHPEVCDNSESSHARRVHKHGLHNYLRDLMNDLQLFGVSASKVEAFIPFLVLGVFGKRHLEKQALAESQVSLAEQHIYRVIRDKLANPVRKQRIFDFMNSTTITKRLINFFVVHYVLIHKEVSYFLDKRVYPHRIVGEINQPFQPEIKERGEGIVWVNLHQEYKASKTKSGKSNLHAPYARSVSIKGDDNQDYSLCALNFYCWLDEIGGFEAFEHFESDVREKKREHDARRRTLQSEKSKKRKVVLKQTDGRNYKTYVSQGCMPDPYDGLQENLINDGF
jgi:hypothetical protein